MFKNQRWRQNETLDRRGRKLKKYALVIAALALVLTGCASDRSARESNYDSLSVSGEGVRPFSRAWFIRYNPLMAALARPVRLFPIVYVDDSQIIVDQEPIHVRTNEGKAQPVKIEWTIGDAGYSFPDNNSVTIKVESGPAPTNVTCFAQGQAPYTTFICHYKRPSGKSKYSYTIKVTDGTTTYLSDPYVVNE